MIRKIIGISFLAVVSLLLSMTGCSSASSGGITTAQAITAAQTVNGGFYVALDNSTTVGTAISCSTAGLSMTGTTSTVGSTTTDDLTIVFSGYVDAATGYTVSGTINASVIIVSGTISGTITGELTLSGGAVAKQTWNVNVSGSSSDPTYTGTATMNGDSFDASTLSLNSVTHATQAAIVSQRITQVMQNKSLWTGSSSVSYTLNSNVAMTGTLTTVGSTDTYSLTITCSNDSESPYTVSGSFNLLLAVNNVSHTIASGTVTGNLTLSGGTVTTETWNISNISGSANPGAGSYMASYAGTVTCNGTPFDAKTLYLQ